MKKGGAAPADSEVTLRCRVILEAVTDPG
jgi:hypothetical protein